MLPEHHQEYAKNNTKPDSSMLTPMSDILDKISLKSTWEHLKLTECLKILFSDVVLPAYGGAV